MHGIKEKPEREGELNIIDLSDIRGICEKFIDIERFREEISVAVCGGKSTGAVLGDNK